MCLDHACYHRSAPLRHGDIEDLALDGSDGAYITCPLHDYKINMSTGEAFARRKPEGEDEFRMMSKGAHQRVHAVHEGPAPPLGVSSESTGSDAAAAASGESWVWVLDSGPEDVRSIIAAAADAVEASGEVLAPGQGPAGLEGLEVLKERAAAGDAEAEAGLAAATTERRKLVRKRAAPEGWVMSDNCAHVPFE